MALRRITPHKKPFLHPRPFSSSSSSVPPFPPPPPSPSNDRNDPHSPSPHGPNPGERPNAASSLFQDIRERLRSSPAAPPPRRIPNPPLRSGGSNAQQPAPSFDLIRRQLESYRTSRSDGGAPPPPSAGTTPSFQDLLRNSSPPASPQGPNPGTKQSFGFDSIRDSIRNIGSSQQRRPPGQSPFLSSIPPKVFGKELGERSRKVEGAVAGKEEDSGIALLRDYSYEELGKKLEKLRPAAVGKDGKEWFSLEELQGRLAKLAELDKEEDKRFGGQYAAFRNSLTDIKNTQKAEEERKRKTMQGVSFIANIVGQATPEYMHHPPQEELVERYFHPDHMSSEEKMKLELQKVRDEFKMSENDCGSARVQIAQLTLKIKHLSSVLHKKDKHSRKGLQEMVQRRKKYLKYLRRTDWDSYCLVLSKLGLRDVPEYKAPDYKSKSINKPKPKKTKSKSKSRGKKKLKI